MSANYYTTLGVPKDVDPTALKKAYRKLAMTHHPDKNPGNSEAAETFKKISEAYTVLSDPEKRPIYDKYGADGVQQMEGGGQSADPSDIFERMFGGMGGGMGGMGGMFGERPRRQQQQQKRASRATAHVDLKTLVRGGSIKVQFSDTVAKDLQTGKTSTEFECCGECRGEGAVTETRMIAPGMFQQASGKCPACDGRGFQLSTAAQKGCIWIDEIKEYDVHLPPGHILQEPLVLFEKGGACIDPHTKAVGRGDLHVQIKCRTKEHDEWQLYSVQHRHLQWTPTLQVVYGMVTNRLKCVHPDGKEYIIEMPPKKRTETIVAAGMGLPASEDGRVPVGDLLIKVNWDFSTATIDKLPWLAQMKEAMHTRAPWTNAAASQAHVTCMTTDEYESYQSGSSRGGGGHHRRGHHGHRSEPPHAPPAAADSRRGTGGGGGGGGGAQECVQS
jgi:DnaJ-class molecular chaperone